jgi:cellulose biosynthesis protein BcsQ
MSIPEVIDALKEFAKQYYPLIGLVMAVGSAIGFRERLWDFLQKFAGVDVHLKTENERLRAEKQKLQNVFDDLRTLFTDDKEKNFWKRLPVKKPDGFDINHSIPIILVANLKGGVGKTTTSAYLTAYFEREKNETVLAIDLDHQGSLCSMLSPRDQLRTAKRADGVKKIIQGQDGDLSLSQTVDIRDTKKGSRLIECDDTFGNFEMLTLLEWLVGDKGDIRYNLAKVLHSPAVQEHFDRVIIDAPPGMTTGHVNALCASTHLVVPFVLDIMSAERVGAFLNRIKDMKGELFPQLRLAAVVGTLRAAMVGHLRPVERDAIEEARAGVNKYWEPGSGDDCVREDFLIPRKQNISNASGVEVDPQNIKYFEPLGQRICAVAPSRKQLTSVAA